MFLRAYLRFGLIACFYGYTSMLVLFLSFILEMCLHGWFGIVGSSQPLIFIAFYPFIAISSLGIPLGSIDSGLALCINSILWVLFFQLFRRLAWKKKDADTTKPVDLRVP